LVDVEMFCVVLGAMLVAVLLIEMFDALSLPFTPGEVETTRMRYPVPVVVKAGIVAEMLCEPEPSEVTDCNVTGDANEPAAFES
jgi:hypothetical protein